MTVTLESFPAELLCLITSSLSAFCITRLWFCGSANLNNKLRAQGGVTRFVLDATTERFRPQWPSIASTFSKLEHFTFIASTMALYAMEFVSELSAPSLKELVIDANVSFQAPLAVLFPHLEHLELRNANASWLFGITNFHEQLPLSLRLVLLERLTLPPIVLESLYIALRDLRQLKQVTVVSNPHIRDFMLVAGAQAQQPPAAPITVAKALVPVTDNMEYLKWHSNIVAMETTLPSGLKRLDFCDTLGIMDHGSVHPTVFDVPTQWHNLHSLHSLTELKITLRRELTVEEVKWMPRSLLSLQAYSSLFRPTFVTQEICKALPPMLTSLSGHFDCMNDVRFLPPLIRDLRIELQMTTLGLSEAQRQELRVLHVKNLDKTTAKLLPSRLERLKAFQVPAEAFDKLPAVKFLEVTHLRDSDETYDVTRLREGLESLYIQTMESLRFDFFPKTLRRLHLGLRVPFVSLRWIDWSRFLPETLVELVLITHLPIPYGDSWLESIPKSLETLRLAEFRATVKPIPGIGEEYCGFSQKCISLIPNTITDLGISLACTLDGTAFFKSLPPSLTKLNFHAQSYSNVTTDSFSQLPPKLTSLSASNWSKTASRAALERDVAKTYGVHLNLQFLM